MKIEQITNKVYYSVILTREECIELKSQIEKFRDNKIKSMWCDCPLLSEFHELLK